MTKPNESPGTDLPRGIGAPATRALTVAGYASLEQLAGVPEAELLALHGVGPKALTVLREVMAERGLALG
jgi:DNA-directed RNA polymerase alpha subunit